MLPIILNAENVVVGTNNSKYAYRFPLTADFRKTKLALGSLSIYRSWQNVTTAFNNNSFSYIWVDGLTYTVTLPDGFYEVADVNAYMQSVFVKNGHFLVDSSGNYRYYIVLETNASFYAVQVNCYAFPTSLPAGWLNPAALPFPLVPTTPQLVVPDTNFQQYIGFTAGTYPTTPQTTEQSFLSDFTPQVSPVMSVVILCSLVNNRLSIPNNILYTFSPTGSGYGDLIQINPGQFSFAPIQDGLYQEFYVQLTDQNYNPLNILDNQLVLQLLIDDSDKNSK